MAFVAIAGFFAVFAWRWLDFTRAARRLRAAHAIDDLVAGVHHSRSFWLLVGCGTVLILLGQYTVFMVALVGISISGSSAQAGHRFCNW